MLSYYGDGFPVFQSEEISQQSESCEDDTTGFLFSDTVVLLKEKSCSLINKFKRTNTMDVVATCHLSGMHFHIGHSFSGAFSFELSGLKRSNEMLYKHSRCRRIHLSMTCWLSPQCLAPSLVQVSVVPRKCILITLAFSLAP